MTIEKDARYRGWKQGVNEAKTTNTRLMDDDLLKTEWNGRNGMKSMREKVEE